MPYFSYAKGDKKDEPRVSIRARLVAGQFDIDERCGDAVGQLQFFDGVIGVGLILQEDRPALRKSEA